MTPCRTQWQRKWLELDVTSPAVQSMADAVEGFCGRWFRCKPDPSLLVLAGTCGVGKSHAAKAVFNYAQRASMSAFDSGAWDRHASCPGSLFLRWPETVDTFKTGEYGVLVDCFETALLILDDVGAEHDPSANGVAKLCQILSRRERLFTLITTNIEPNQWATRFDARIADRFFRNSVIVDLFTVTSYALQTI